MARFVVVRNQRPAPKAGGQNQGDPILKEVRVLLLFCLLLVVRVLA